jgi:D-galactarolactone isomerase
VGTVNPFPHDACDTHVHVYDHRHPIAPTTVLAPPDASVADYRTFQATLGLDRVVLVQPTTYGLDNACQIEAAAAFGESARLVVVVDHRTDHEELDRLDRLGARGARFHLLPGGAVGWDALRPVADRIAEHGWHVQLQMDGRLLIDRLDELLDLPTPLVVDHVGRFMPPVAPDDERFSALLTLLDTGRCWVKLSAPYESTSDGAPGYPTVTALVRVLVERFPERLVWASNWPHPSQAHPPDAGELRRLAVDWLPTAELRRRILVENPAELYGFPPAPHPSSEETP